MSSTLDQDRTWYFMFASVRHDDRVLRYGTPGATYGRATLRGNRWSHERSVRAINYAAALHPTKAKEHQREDSYWFAFQYQPSTPSATFRVSRIVQLVDDVGPEENQIVIISATHDADHHSAHLYSDLSPAEEEGLPDFEPFTLDEEDDPTDPWPDDEDDISGVSNYPASPEWDPSDGPDPDGNYDEDGTPISEQAIRFEAIIDEHTEGA